MRTTGTFVHHRQNSGSLICLCYLQCGAVVAFILPDKKVGYVVISLPLLLFALALSAYVPVAPGGKFARLRPKQSTRRHLIQRPDFGNQNNDNNAHFPSKKVGKSISHGVLYEIEFFFGGFSAGFSP